MSRSRKKSPFLDSVSTKDTPQGIPGCELSEKLLLLSSFFLTIFCKKVSFGKLITKHFS